MSITKIIGAATIAAGLIATTGTVWAQGGGETPRPQTSNPSSTVDTLTGRPPVSPGMPGNPTGNRQDVPVVQPPANALPAGPSNVQGNRGTQGTENRPAGIGRSQPPSPTN